MISTGNDIVSLDAIDRQRTIQPRFYSKILAPSEQALYSLQGSSGLPFENFVWLLWSIKESIYKYRQRLETGLVFSPTKIVVRQLTVSNGETGPGWDITGGLLYQGIIYSGSAIFYSRSMIHDEYISTVVSEDEQFGGVWWGVASIGRTGYAEQSASARALLLNKLYSLLPEDAEVLRIEKNPEGCPLLFRGGKETEIPVSLAHHGQFVAYSVHY